jgi:hypothetical protein
MYLHKDRTKLWFDPFAARSHEQNGWLRSMGCLRTSHTSHTITAATSNTPHTR